MRPFRADSAAQIVCRFTARAHLLMFTEIVCVISDYVRGAGFEPKVFLSQEVSADYGGPCGEDSVISSDVHEEVLTAVSRGPSRAGPWSLPHE